MNALRWRNLFLLALLISLALLPDEGVTVIQDRQYMKVASTFPSVQNCILRKDVLKVRSKMACATLCTQTPDCSLYCLKRYDCILLNARVTLKWEGLASATAADSFDSCYSSWAHGNDMAYLANASAISYYRGRVPSHAIDGFACGFSASYCTSIYSGSWMRIDFPNATSFSEIRINYENSATYPDMYLGNSTTFTENVKIASPEDTRADAFRVLSFKPRQEVVGKYLHLIGYANYLNICELIAIV